jgi:hypothetical protein
MLVAGEAVGVLTLYTEEAGLFDEELKLLTELAGDIAFVSTISKAGSCLAPSIPLRGSQRTLFHDRLCTVCMRAGEGRSSRWWCSTWKGSGA